MYAFDMVLTVSTDNRQVAQKLIEGHAERNGLSLEDRLRLLGQLVGTDGRGELPEGAGRPVAREGGPVHTAPKGEGSMKPWQYVVLFVAITVVTIGLQQCAAKAGRMSVSRIALTQPS